LDIAATIPQVGGTVELVTRNGKELSELIASLPEEERVILTLFYLKSTTPSEIAELIGVPLRAVESVLQTGRQRLLSAIGLMGGITDGIADGLERSEAEEG